MSKYRKKPVVIDAFLLGVDDEPEWFMNAKARHAVRPNRTGDESNVFYIDTLEGWMKACPCKDYIIRGVEGELYPCKADIFEKTYEAVTDDE